MKKILLSATLAIGLAGFFSQVHAEERNLKDYNLNDGVSLHGFDPVAVFPEGGSSALMGSTELVVNQKGVIYQFANEGNKQTFEANPEAYEPSFGGYCAYAMASGCKIDIQPDIFTIKGDRIHYFVSQRAKRNFDANADQLEAQADVNYERMKTLDIKLGECLP